MKRQPPFDPSLSAPIDGIWNSDPEAPYVNGNPSTGQEGSIPPFEAIDHPQREIVEVIEQAGIEPDHEDLTQLWQALQWLVGERLVESIGAGTIPIYAGIAEDGAHQIRSVQAGANITLELVENPPSSGRHYIRISATGAGGGAVSLANVGDGAGEVYKGHNAVTGNEDLRTVKGINGIITRNNGSVIEVDGSGILARPPDLLLRDERATGTPGGTYPSASTWQRLTLNTVVRNTLGATLATNQVTLPAGSYVLRWKKAAALMRRVSTRLYNVTDSAVVEYSLNDFTQGGIGLEVDGLSSVWSHGLAIFTLAGPKALALDIWGTHSDGGAVSTFLGHEIGVTGRPERYCEVEVYKYA